MTALPFRKTKLALAAALLFGVSTSASYGAITHFLNNCNDSGTGSLRSAIASANSGDTIQLTEVPIQGHQVPLACSSITLSTGALAITQANLTIEEPAGLDPISLQGDYQRVLNHTGAGTITLSGFTIEYGYYYRTTAGGAQGGCITSRGTVELDSMTVRYCSISGQITKGGGVFSLGVTRLSNSLVSENSASTPDGIEGLAFGGGIYALGGFQSINSVISSNQVTGGGCPECQNTGGAAVFAQGSAYLRGTTIADNFQDTQQYGSAVTIENSSGGFAVVTESTFSSNTARYALSISAALPITISNSTIFANSTVTGVKIHNLSSSGYPYMWSNIVAASGAGVVTSSNVHGANNFVTGGIIGGPVFPGDTLTSGCIFLGPLRDNGGSTPTHALMSHSILIDKGDTEAGDQPLDQRGLPRVSGAAADIGAYEVQKNDIIFNTEFEGCM
jgi:hypothetical protein